MVSDIPAGDGKIENLFLQCTLSRGFSAVLILVPPLPFRWGAARPKIPAFFFSFFLLKMKKRLRKKTTKAKFLVPDWGDIVDTAIGFVVPARQPM
jgi:hypothetical protein